MLRAFGTAVASEHELAVTWCEFGTPNCRAQEESLRIGEEVGPHRSQSLDVDLSLFEPVATQELAC